jgi:hypothetical protein
LDKRNDQRDGEPRLRGKKARKGTRNAAFPTSVIIVRRGHEVSNRLTSAGNIASMKLVVCMVFDSMRVVLGMRSMQILFGNFGCGDKLRLLGETLTPRDAACHESGDNRPHQTPMQHPDHGSDYNEARPSGKNVGLTSQAHQWFHSDKQFDFDRLR